VLYVEEMVGKAKRESELLCHSFVRLTSILVWRNISTFIFAALPPHRHTDLTALTLDRTDLTPRTPSTTLIFAALTLYRTDLAARTPSTTLISPHSLSTALISQNKTIKYFSDFSMDGYGERLRA